MLHNERGSTLLTAILVFSIVLIFGTILLARGEYSMTETASDIAAERARYASKSGLDAAIYWLNNGEEADGTKVINNVVADISKYANTGNIASNLEDGSKCIIHITRPDSSDVPAGANVNDYLLITSTGKSKYTSALTKTTLTISPTSSSEALVKEYTSKALVKIKRGGSLFNNGVAFAGSDLNLAGNPSNKLTIYGDVINQRWANLQWLDIKKNATTGEGGNLYMYPGGNRPHMTDLNIGHLHLASNASVEMHRSTIGTVTATQPEPTNCTWNEVYKPDITVDTGVEDDFDELKKKMQWDTIVTGQILQDEGGYGEPEEPEVENATFVEYTKINDAGDTMYYAITPAEGTSSGYRIIDRFLSTPSEADLRYIYSIDAHIRTGNPNITKHKFFFCNADPSANGGIEWEVESNEGYSDLIERGVSIYVYSPEKRVNFNSKFPNYVKGGIVVGSMGGGNFFRTSTLEYESDEEGLPIGSETGSIIGCDVIEYK